MGDMVLMTIRIRSLTLFGTLMLVVALAAPGFAQTPPSEADYSAYSTGTVIHAEALEAPELQDPTSTRAVDSEIAFSSALVDTTGLDQDRHNEWGGLVMPAQEDKTAYGRGYGMDAAFGGEGGTDDPQMRLAGLAEAAAPPETGPVVEEFGPVPADPLAYATLVRGEAYAQPPGCVIGSDISYGTGYVEDAELLDQSGSDEEGQEQEGLEDPVLATNAHDPERSVSWSTSRNFLGPQINTDGERIGDDVGVVAETRMTIAPVTLQLGADDPETEEDESTTLTIEFLGEWVLRAHAGGIEESAHIHYGPGETGTTSPSTPILRFIQDGEVQDELTFQDILGDEGLVVDALPLAEIAIGEDPRAIGGDADSEPEVAADGTSASAAVDVVRIKLLSDPETGEASEVRIGHMEVAATAPPGGLPCDLRVDKTADKALVEPGDEFTYSILVPNNYDCTLRNVRVVDTITADEGVTWAVTGTDPEADSVSDTEIVWNDVGPIEPGGSVTLTIDVSVGEDSQAGFFHDEAAVPSSECDGVPLEGRDTIDLPEVRVPAAAAPPALPTTGGGALSALAGLALIGAAAATWRKQH